MISIADRLLVHVFFCEPNNIQAGLDNFMQNEKISTQDIVSINVLINTANPIAATLNLYEVLIFYSHSSNINKQENTEESSDS